MAESVVSALAESHMRQLIEHLQAAGCNMTYHGTAVEDTRFAEKSAENLVRAIAASKENSLDRLIYALGIRGIGSRAAKLLCEHFPTMDALLNATAAEIQEIDGFGETMAESVVSALAESHMRLCQCRDHAFCHGFSKAVDLLDLRSCCIKQRIHGGEMLTEQFRRPAADATNSKGVDQTIQRVFL